MAQFAQMPALGDVVDARYRLEREIGRGSVGVVFEASELESGRRLALKILRPRIISEQNSVERFEREARLASRLTNPHSIQIHRFGVHHGDGSFGLPYIAMEYLQGVDLEAYLERRGALSIGETVGILLQALESLAEAHEQGIVHRDLKPGNVFLCNTESGEPAVKVLDYGTAKLVRATSGDPAAQLRLTADGMICGTPQCMAPEQALGKRPLTPAVDVYAMGCLGYHMLVGRPLYDGPNKIEVARQHVHEPIPPMPPAYARSAVGKALLKALTKEPGERFAEAPEMAAALREASARDRIEVLGHDAAGLDAYEEELFDPYGEEGGFRQGGLGGPRVFLGLAAAAVVVALVVWLMSVLQ